MSFDQLSSMESQPTTMRRSDDPEYRDDPEFSRFAEELSVKLFSLTSNISRLSQQISLLGTRRDTERVRERVHDLLEEARNGFKEVGEGIKKLTAWENVSVRTAKSGCRGPLLIAFEYRHHKNIPSKSFPGNFKLQALNSSRYSGLLWRNKEPRPRPRGLRSTRETRLIFLGIRMIRSRNRSSRNKRSYA